MPNELVLGFWWFFSLFTIMLIGVTKSGFGSGVGLMITPSLTLCAKHIMPGHENITMGLVLILLVFGDVLAIWQYRKMFDKAVIKRLLRGSILGLIIGGLLLKWFHAQTKDMASLLIRLEVGFESVFLVSLHWYRQLRKTEKPYVSAQWKDDGIGFFAAASSTLAHAAGPIIALHLLPQKLGRDIFVGTCAVYFFLVNTSKIPVYWGANVFEGHAIRYAFYAAPLVLVGAFFGKWVKSKINDQVFTQVIYAATFILGIYLFSEASWILLHRG